MLSSDNLHMGFSHAYIIYIDHVLIITTIIRMIIISGD